MHDVEEFPAQRAALERLRGQYDTVIVSATSPLGALAVTATCLENPEACPAHADDGIDPECEACTFDELARFVVTTTGDVRGA